MLATDAPYKTLDKQGTQTLVHSIVNLIGTAQANVSSLEYALPRDPSATMSHQHLENAKGNTNSDDTSQLVGIPRQIITETADAWRVRVEFESLLLFVQTSGDCVLESLRRRLRMILRLCIPLAVGWCRA